MDGWRVALLYNLKGQAAVAPESPPDALAELDTVETVQGLEDALLAGGHQVIPLEADETLLERVREADPDICFNIAEGRRGDARESQVPALLEMLGIPYTGSKVLAHAISLDKAIAKRVWRDLGLPTAPFQLFHSEDEPLDRALTFPLFVKPVREGSGMGISSRSVVQDEPALRERLRLVLSAYHQPALVEPFLPGREFTVGLIGNSIGPGEYAPKGYDRQGFHVFPVLEIDLSPVEEAQGIYSSYTKSERPLDCNYLCPAPIDAALASELQWLAVEAFRGIDALDVARVDFRLGADGRPYLMEINTLPGLNATYSDIVMAARAEGMTYTDLVNEILNLAVDRYGLVWDRGFSRRRLLQRAI